MYKTHNLTTISFFRFFRVFSFFIKRINISRINLTFTFNVCRAKRFLSFARSFCPCTLASTTASPPCKAWTSFWAAEARCRRCCSCKAWTTFWAAEARCRCSRFCDAFFRNRSISYAAMSSAAFFDSRHPTHFQINWLLIHSQAKIYHYMKVLCAPTKQSLSIPTMKVLCAP